MDTSTDVVYDSTVKYQIVAVYIISMIIWLVLVIALKMNEGLASIVIIIPFLVFMISFSSGWDFPASTLQRIIDQATQLRKPR